MDAARVPPDVRRVVLRVFTRKHHLQLRSDAVVFVHDTLAEHGLLADADGTVEAVEALAAAVVEQHVASGDVPGFDGLVVTRDALQYVYDQLLVQGTESSSAAAAVTQGAAPDPSRFFAVVDAFAQPRVVFDHVRRVFERGARPRVLAPAGASSALLRERYELLRSIVLRNEHFAPQLAPGAHAALRLATTKDLLGRQGESCLLFGRLSTTADGRYALEDAEGSVALELEEAVPGEGIFTEGAFVLVEGTYTDAETLHVLAVGHPPSESRAAAQRLYGHVDFCGTGALTPKSLGALRAYEAQNSDQCIAVFSDVHLDHERSLAQLHAILQGYDRAGFIPFALVLCGNFFSTGETDGEYFERYRHAFGRLGEVLAQFPRILAASHFVFVPGPSDPVATPLCPRARIAAPLVERFERRLPRAFVEHRLHWASNPCRLVYFSQEIVVFRDDIMSRMLRSAVHLGPVRDGDLHKYLVSTLLDQANLSPLPHQVRPVLWDHGHALRLYPMPSALVLADRCEHYELTYEGCRVFNPGPFRGGLYSWTTFYPSTGHAERRYVSGLCTVNLHCDVAWRCVARRDK